jgi:predicted  nucleic acid-binding Zn-ribbon protein
MESSEGSEWDAMPELKSKAERLIELCSQASPADMEVNERDELIRYFRKNGFTSRGISQLVGGRLKPDTIRKICSGVEVQDARLKQRLDVLVGRLVRSDIEVQDVEEITSMQENLLGPSGLTMEDVVSFVKELQNLDLGTKEIVSTYREQRDSGLSFAQLNELLAFKNNLDEMALTKDNLRQISDIARKNGNVAAVLESVLSFDNLEAIENTIKLKQTELAGLEEKIGGAESQLKKIQVESQHLQSAIALCEELIYTQKYTITAIRSIQKIARKYGSPFDVIEAIGAYETLQAINHEIEERSRTKNQLDAEIVQRKCSNATLRGQEEAIKTTMSGLLTPVSNEIAQTYRTAIQGITETFQDKIRDMGETGIKLGRALEASEAVRSDINMVKTIRNIVRSPEEARGVPMDLAIFFLHVANNILRGKRDRTTIELVDARLMPADNYWRSRRVSVVSLVQGAIIALESPAANASEAQ